ncbi:unnamed protein product, partial [marine sediment metagenome]
SMVDDKSADFAKGQSQLSAQDRSSHFARHGIVRLT